MFKEHRILSDIAKAVDEAAEVANRVLNSHEDIKGREEEITSELRFSITCLLLDGIKERLHGRTIRGVKLGAYVLKRSTEEPRVGADLAGIIRLTVGNTTISKTFLAQAKVGEFRDGDKYPVVPYNKKLLSQCRKMLERSSDSFVFIYTERGIFVVPALSVRLANKKSLNLRKHYYGIWQILQKLLPVLHRR